MTGRKSHQVRIKRAYDAPSREDGRRVLVDRMWPRGLTREKLAVDDWLKDAAPSDALRRWFNHDPARWAEFTARYREELKAAPARDAVAELARAAREGPVTLVYAASDEAHNNAVALRDVLVQHLSRPRSPTSPGRSSANRR